MEWRSSEECREALQMIYEHEQRILTSDRYLPLPPLTEVSSATSKITHSLEAQGLGTLATTEHLLYDLSKGLNGSSLSSTYYGFVTGGITPAARIADHITTLYDQNASVHLPDQSIATAIESKALEMMLELLQLELSEWPGRTLTTGATASNILGLACGKQWVLERHVQKRDPRETVSITGLGLLKACKLADLEDFQILTTKPHSSLCKAANIVGLGDHAVVDVACDEDLLQFDLLKLEEHLAIPRMGSIVAISCGEVNTGGFATHSLKDVQDIRELCNRYNAWLHVDGAFGIFTRCLVESGLSFARVASGGQGMELADSITGDGHKMLNVPYDCGFFFTRHDGIQSRVFQNPNAAYLKTKASDIPSPLNIGLENSRRFRGLPLYATLVANGRLGYVDMVKRQVTLARAIAKWIASSSSYELLYPIGADLEEEIFTIVLFRARDAHVNENLVRAINQSCQIYVSGTTWRDQPASRIAISNWQADVKIDLDRVIQVLETVAPKR